MEPEITDIFDRIMNWKLLRFTSFFSPNHAEAVAAILNF